MTLLFLLAAMSYAGSPGRIESRRSERDFALTADPKAAPWRSVRPAIAGNDRYGKPVPAHRTEIRTRWTTENLYILFVCPYTQLNMKPNPGTAGETNRLWEFDVAEVFIGSDFENIHRYKEFQVSPQGEWVDLDIDRKEPKPEGGWRWNSGFTVKARIDAQNKIWYGEMKIPLRSIDPRAPKAGNEMRINFYRIQGPGKERVHIAWNPVNNPSYHTPEAFGRIVLVK